HTSNALDQNTAGSVLTIGPGVTIRGSSGNVSAVSSTVAVINQGTIVTDVPGGRIFVTLGAGGRNEGVMQALVSSGVSTQPALVVTASGAGTWTNRASWVLTPLLTRA